MTRKFNVDGTFSTQGTKDGSSNQLPARSPEILPPSSQQDWRPRPADEISIPSPVLRRTLFGRPDHERFRQELWEVEQSEKAVTGLVKTRTEKEHAVNEYERTLAKRECMPALLEQDRLTVLGDVAIARSALQRTLAHINRQENEVNQASLNDRRIHELEAIEFETELARKRQVLAEEKVKAANAEQIAELRARAEQTSAERDLRDQEARLKRAQRQVDRAQIDDAEGTLTEDDDPPEFRRAMENQRKLDDIARAARRREAAILARVGGDETLLSAEERETLEGIRQAKARAQESIDKAVALGAIFPYADDDGETRP